jgi:hypothetical protein
VKNNKPLPKTKNHKIKSNPKKGLFSRFKYLFTDILWKKRSRLARVFIVFAYITTVLIASAYSIGVWYQLQHKDEPLEIGATFVPNYARYFELDPEETLQAMIDDLGIKRFRLVSYWNMHEKQPDVYDFSELDWQFDMIEEAGGTVALSLGLRQPRWPECHGPEWAMAKTVPEWTEDLKEYMGVLIDRYKDREVLVEYQLENEFLLTVFGDCPDHSRERLIDEFNYVKSKDSTRPLIVNRSNNAVPSWPINEPRADKVGAAVYKRVWDKTVTKRNFEYPLPEWFYSFLAGGTELTTGRESIIHELQTESWLPENVGYDMRDAPIDKLYDTFSPEILPSRIEYGVNTGIRTIDLWGVEWWYQMKTMRNAPELWDTAKTELAKYR